MVGERQGDTERGVQSARKERGERERLSVWIARERNNPYCLPFYWRG